MAEKVGKKVKYSILYFCLLKQIWMGGFDKATNVLYTIPPKV